MNTQHLHTEYSCGIDFYPQLDIIYCRSRNDWTTIMLKGYSTCNTRKTLKDIELKLQSSHFLRVHRSYLVNLMHVDRISGSFLWLHMKDGHTVPVSRWKRGHVKESLREFLGWV